MANVACAYVMLQIKSREPAGERTTLSDEVSVK